MNIVTTFLPYADGAVLEFGHPKGLFALVATTVS